MRNWLCKSLMGSFVLVALACAGDRRSQAEIPSTAAVRSTQTARLYTFQLRKLHLARPDLIPYPFAYEVYC
jgi:hypothetical protein